MIENHDIKDSIKIKILNLLSIKIEGNHLQLQLLFMRIKNKLM